LVMVLLLLLLLSLLLLLVLFGNAAMCNLSMSL